MFSDQYKYPAGRVTNGSVGAVTAAEIFPATALATKINWHILSCSATARVATFRVAGAGDTFMVVSVPANSTVVVPGWEVPAGGLEVISSAGTDLNVSTFFWQP